ncbi:MAG: SGNH/GDSL hydrolase family protein [Thermocrispum sp.]
MKRRFALPALAAAAAFAAVSLAVPSQAENDELNYVALGDSFSAGSGILPLDSSTTPLCARTTKNFPHVIAAATGAKLTDVTCGGAQTTHFTDAQYPGLTEPQFDALSADTDLVTLTIGGNDANLFIGAIASCGFAGISTGGFGSPCKTRYGEKFNDDIRDTIYPAIRQALEGIAAKAPNARVAILGYPWILPEHKGCFPKMPVARGDVPYLRELQGNLNAAVQRAASGTGATYVDLNGVSDGHDACQPIGTRWVEPALFGTNFVPVHPNALGERKMAEQAMTVLGLS